MGKKSFGLTLLYWVEVVLSIRVLLFAVPVILNKFLSGQAACTLSEKFIWVLTLVCIAYLGAGISAILGHRLNALFHYGACALSCILTAMFLAVLSSRGLGFQPGYALPGIIPLIFLGLMLYFKSR